MERYSYSIVKTNWEKKNKIGSITPSDIKSYWEARAIKTVALAGYRK